MQKNLLFSVIIPTCNRRDLLALCLDALQPGRQTLPASTYQVIVSDDGSNGEVEKMILQKYSWAVFVHGQSKGPAANRNNGVRCAKGEWLVFIDDDCIPDKEWLRGYYDYLQNHPNIKVLEGRTYVDTKRRSLAETSPLNTSGGYLWSCNLAIEKNLFLNLEGFNEQFPYPAMEDVAFRTKITQANIPFRFVEQAAVMHPWRKKGGWKNFIQHGKSTFIYLSIYPEESKNINSVYYLEKTSRQLIKVTFPGIFRYRSRGLGIALLEHFADLRMFFLLLFKGKT